MTSTTPAASVDRARSVAVSHPAAVITHEISDRIAVARFVLIVGIVLLHIPPHQTLAELGLSPLEFAKGFISGALFRTALPVLTAISAYLLFATKRSHVDIIVNKVRTLIIPLVVWNVPVAIGIALLQRFAPQTHEFSETLWPPDALAWLNALLALTSAPANFPLYFLRDLFVLAAISPLLRPLASHAPVAGMLLVLTVATQSLDGPLLLRNDLLIYYYLGAVARLRSWNIRALDEHATTCLVLLLLLAFLTTVLDLALGVGAKLFAIFLVWPSTSLLRGSIGAKLLRVSDASFLIFLAHGPLLAVCAILFGRLFPVPYWVFWMTAAPLCVVICLVMDRLMRQHVPALRFALVGGR